MEQTISSRQAILAQFHSYPRMEIQDLFKFLFQSAFGCEHMVSSAASVTSYLRREWENLPDSCPSRTEHLDGDFSRVHLGYLNQGLSPDTLGNLFCLSAQPVSDGKTQLLKKLEVARDLIREGGLPFTSESFESQLSQWASAGYPPVHHSDTFRRVYRPAYRVLNNRYVDFLPLFESIDKLLQPGPAVIAIEGGSASGKSTLGQILQDIYGCTVLHMDDFFLRPEQRNPARFAEIGGNIDHERFLEEVLKPLSRRETIHYRRFDCSSGTIAPGEKVVPGKLTVIEGAYSMHPTLSGFYDFSLFLDISPELQAQRIARRNSPEMARRFHEEWIPMEHRYFSGMDVPQRCSMVLPIFQ